MIMSQTVVFYSSSLRRTLVHHIAMLRYGNKAFMKYRVLMS